MREKYINMKRLGTILLATVVIGGIVLGIGPRFKDAATPSGTPSIQAMPTAQAISLFQGRVEANQSDAVSSTILGELFSQQARETGDVSRLDSAESALNRALAALPGYPRAQTALASVYVAQHKFSEALDLARIADEADPDGGAIITIGDAQLALGQYEAAQQSFLEAIGRYSAPAVTARLAHIDEIYGDLDGARLSVDKATTVFIGSGGSGEAAAWFQMRRGDLAFADGDYPAALDAYQQSLNILPEYPASLAGAGRSLAALGDMAPAIGSYESAVAVQPLPQILLELGELYLLNDQYEEAERAFGTIKVVGDLTDGLFDLSLAFFEANHGDPQVAVTTAEQLVEARPDLFSYDALAWAYYRAGRLDEARAASDQAIATSPAVASIWYHSGAIHAERGDNAAGIADLKWALELSPEFNLTSAEHARDLLEELGP